MHITNEKEPKIADSKVSVIILVDNTEKYLRECLDSVVNQTYSSIEVICVDASTDNSLSILSEYADKDPRVKAFSIEHSGAGAARNLGMRMAKGEYLYFIDSDDFCESTLFEKTVQKAEETEADVILFGGKYYFEKDDSFGENDFFCSQWDKEVFSKEIVPERLFQTTNPAPWSKLFRRSFIISNNIEFQEIQNSNDVLFTYTSLALAEKIAAVADSLVYYRAERKGSFQSTKHKTAACCVEAYTALYERIEKAGLLSILERSLTNTIVSSLAYNISTTKSKKELLELGNMIMESYPVKNGLLSHSISYYYDSRAFRELKNLVVNTVEKKFNGYGKPDNDKLVSEPLVSVVLTAYNQSRYLEETLECLVNQTLKDIEIICIDDSSPDSSYAIMQRYEQADKRVKAIKIEPNVGVSAARNIGVYNSSGKYIHFIDGDDLLEPNALEVLFNKAEGLDLDILFHWYHNFRDSSFDESLRVFPAETEYQLVCTDVVSGSQLLKFMIDKNQYNCVPWNWLARREWYMETGLKFPTGYWNEDQFLTPALCVRAERAFRIGDIFLQHRISDTQVTTAWNYPERAESCFIVSELLRSESTSAFMRGDALASNLLSMIASSLFQTGKEFVNTLSLEEKDKILSLLPKNLKFQILENEHACEQENSFSGQLETIRNTFSWKLGRVITWFPRKVRAGMNCIKENGLRYMLKLFFKKMIKIKI